MKTIWHAVSFLAVVHLLVVMLFLGWLAGTGRLDGEKLARIRGVLAGVPAEPGSTPPIPSRGADVITAAGPVGPSSEAVVAGAGSERMRLELARQRLETEMRKRSDELAVLRLGLQARIQEQAAREASWQAAIETELARREDAGFRAMVRKYEALGGRQTRDLLLDLVAQDRLDDAVAILAALSDRAAAKALRELDHDDRLANELLDGIRRQEVAPLERAARSSGSPASPRDDDPGSAAPTADGIIAGGLDGARP